MASASRHVGDAGADGGGTTGPMSPSGASSRSTITGAWSLGPLPLRACRSIQAACTRPATRRRREHQVDAHPAVLVEHAGAIVPVAEHPPVGPALAHDVVEPELLDRRERSALGRRDVRLAHVGLGVEHVLVGRRDVHVAADDRRLGPGGEQVAQRREPGELVAVVLGVGGAAVRDVDRDDADAAARRGDRARLLVREPGPAREPGDDVVEPDAREDRHAVPRRLAVGGDLVPAPLELVAEQLRELVVGELRLLQADDVGLPLVEPWQQPRHALLDRVDVPRRDPHGGTVLPGRVSRVRVFQPLSGPRPS